MKKILWLIFLCLIVNKVDAKVYYSEYSEFSPFQEEAIISSDTIDVIKEARYLWYKDTKILGEYKLYNDIDDFSDNCYMTEFTDWDNLKIDNIGYVYEERNSYNYTMAKGVRYIHLYNLQGSYGSFRIPELDIKYKDKSINYTYTCEGCLEDFDDYIHNGIYEENESYITNGGYLIIDLGREYPIHLIDVIFYIFDLGNSDKLYTIGYSKDKKNLLYSKSYNLKFSDEYWKNAVKRIHNADDIDTKIWQYNELNTSPKDNDYVIKEERIKQYRYQEKWCKVYILEKEYSNYSKEPVNDYINKVEESLKHFYSYRTRDKLEIDIKEITEKNFDLNNFIIYSSDDVNINSNINWNKNGIYNISFQINDLIVNEKVKLNIESNTIEELNEIIKDYENKIKELEEQLNNCNLDKVCLNKKIIELNNLIKHYKDELNNLECLNNMYLDKIKELEDDIKNLNKGIGNITKEKEEQLNNLSFELNNYKETNSNLENELENIKMPKFILKIGFLDSKVIIIIFLLLLCISYLIGKKSNKK